jgi:hypothetical protein
LAETFADRWARKERECGLDAFAATLIPCGDDLLPDSAAPRVTFKHAERPAPIWEVYRDQVTWTQLDRELLAAYKVIGSAGAGTPICVAEDTGAVVILDPEYRFRTIRFVNRSVRQLGECLLAYMGEQDAERFREAVRQIDPDAMAVGTFWWEEAGRLEAE